MTARPAKCPDLETLPQRERAYRSLRDRILENSWPPGTQMLEEEVAVNLGMSRTPVREALIRLEEEGLVTVKPRHGMQVRGISPDDMREIHEILLQLEPMAARLAAEKGHGEAELADVFGLLDEMERALTVGDIVAWGHADRLFHREIVYLSGNGHLCDITNRIWGQQYRALMATLRLRPSRTLCNRDHRAVANAIRGGDGVKARAIHLAHCTARGQMLVDLVRYHGLSAL
ncbi:MAG: GntR family transcriptional regulator [Pseudomonadota bacterium]